MLSRPDLGTVRRTTLLAVGRPLRLHDAVRATPRRAGIAPRRPSPADGGPIDGHTLIELIAVLLIGSLALAVGLPAADAQRDRWAVAGAREAVVGVATSARTTAITRGGASLFVDPAGDSVWSGGPWGRSDPVDLRTEFGVDLGPDGSPVELRFGPLGLGRVASRTLVLRRGGAASSLTVSSYGRVRRW